MFAEWRAEENIHNVHKIPNVLKCLMQRNQYHEFHASQPKMKQRTEKKKNTHTHCTITAMFTSLGKMWNKRRCAFDAVSVEPEMMNRVRE